MILIWDQNKGNICSLKTCLAAIYFPILLSAWITSSLFLPILRFQSTFELFTKILHILCSRAPCWGDQWRTKCGGAIMQSERAGDEYRVWGRQAVGAETSGVCLQSSALTTHSKWTPERRPPGTLLIWPLSVAEEEALTAQTPAYINAVIQSLQRMICAEGGFRAKEFTFGRIMNHFSLKQTITIWTN